MTAAQCEDKNVAAVVSLDALIDAVDAQSDTIASYLDSRTGEIYAISEDAFSLAEAGTAADERVPEWQREEVEWARRVSGSDCYLALPTSWELDEWEIMRRFCTSLADDRVRADFLATIHGRGSFRRFKSTLTHHGLWESWHEFRRVTLRERLISWCEKNGVSFEP